MVLQVVIAVMAGLVIAFDAVEIPARNSSAMCGFTGHRGNPSLPVRHGDDARTGEYHTLGSSACPNRTAADVRRAKLQRSAECVAR